MKIFVTGGAGFVGSHLASSLLAQNHDVVIFDNMSNGKKEKISILKEKGAKFIQGDVTNYHILSRSVAKSDFVIHLAAKINVAESIASPESFHAVNVTGTLNLLRACVKNKVRNIITASSAAVYGNQRTLPLHEKSQAIPISPYGATKLAVEHYVQSFSYCYQLNAISLRFFNIYGQGQSFEYAGVIEKFLDRIRKGKPLTIYGNGRNTRDFVSIEDIVQAIMLSMKKIKGKRGNVYNIATGSSVSINDLAKTMVSLSGKKLAIVHNRPKKGDIEHSKASISLAKKDLGYAPQINLKKGLEKLINSN